MIEQLKLIRAYEQEHGVKLLPETTDYEAIKEAVKKINEVLK